MPIITKLERQKHNSRRVSVFVDEEYAFSLSDELIILNKLAVGKDVNLLPLKELAEEDAFSRALTASYELLGRSEKTEKQLREYLAKKEYDEKTADRVIDRLTELGYLDDRAYAERFTENCRSMGKRAIRCKLISRGVPRDVIEEALAEIPEENFRDDALRLAERQQARVASLPLREQKRKLGDFLARRGYDWDTVSGTIERLYAGEEED